MTATPTPEEGEHVSDFAFDRLAAGTLPAEARAAAEAHLAGCARCQQRKQVLDEDRAAFVPDAALLEKLAAPAAEAPANVVPFRPRTRIVQALVPVLAAAAVVALVVTRKPAGDEGDVTTAKGAPIYEVFVDNGEGPRAVSRHDVVHPGEVVQVTRTGPAEGFVGLFSIDGAGTFTRFFPEDGQGLAAVEPGVRVQLPRSVILDDTLGTERFVILECDAALAASGADEVARGGATPAGCVVTPFPLEKR